MRKGLPYLLSASLVAAACGEAEPDTDGRAPGACAVSQALSDEARTFMEENNLIRDGEELVISEALVMRWRLNRAVFNNDTCHLVMDVATFDNGVPLDGDALSLSQEVLILEGNALKTFESMYPDAGRPVHYVNQSNYGFFGTLTGQDAIDFRKSIAAKLHDSTGTHFTHLIVKGAKHPLDPSPDRGWVVAQSKFDLRASFSGETMDIPAEDLDVDFDAMFAGALRMRLEDGREALVSQPWVVSYAEVQDDGTQRWPGGWDQYACGFTSPNDGNYTNLLSSDDQAYCGNAPSFPYLPANLAFRSRYAPNPLNERNIEADEDCYALFCQQQGHPIGVNFDGRYGG